MKKCHSFILPVTVLYEKIPKRIRTLSYDDESKGLDRDGRNEYEDLNSAVIEIKDNEVKELDSDGEMIDVALNALVDEIEKNGYLGETSVNMAEDDVKPPEKKKKFSRLSLLDSPPRKFSSVHFDERK